MIARMKKWLALLVISTKNKQSKVMGLGAKQGCDAEQVDGASPIDLVLFPGLAVQIFGQ